MHVGYREAERSFPFRGPGPSSPRLHSTPPSLFPFLPSFPSARGLVELAQIPRGSRLENRCLSVSTPLPPSRPYAAGAQTGLRAKLFHEAAVARDVGFAFRGTQGFYLFIYFLSERGSQRLGGHHRRRSGGVTRVSQTDALRGILALVPAQDRKGLCLLGLFRGPRADASESPCGRIHSDSFFLLRLGGVENFPQNIPGLRQRGE